MNCVLAVIIKQGNRENSYHYCIHYTTVVVQCTTVVVHHGSMILAPSTTKFIINNTIPLLVQIANRCFAWPPFQNMEDINYTSLLYCS